MSPAPTQIFSGPLSHVGFVVDDIPRAVERWTSAYGAGPFLLLENISFDSIEVPGDESPVTWEHSAAFGRWGEIVVELQQYHDVSATLAEKLRVGSAGFNHISYVVEGPEEASAGLSEAGMPCFVHAT
ncbi:MAG TPA: VOC family protein, partial [Solirubrobacterales bacterium]